MLSLILATALAAPVAEKIGLPGYECRERLECPVDDTLPCRFVFVCVNPSIFHDRFGDEVEPEPDDRS